MSGSRPTPSATTETCTLCDRVLAPTPPPGGWIHRDHRWAVSGHPGLAVPGWLALQTVRHIATFAELDEPEALTLGPLLREVSRWLHRATGTDRTYTYALGESVRHVHLLVGAPPAGADPDSRGGPLLNRIFGRDPTLIDADGSVVLLAKIAALAAGEPKPYPAPRCE